MATNQSSRDAFESAMKEFLDSLTDKETYDFSSFKSINDVYDATDNIQREQGKKGALRNLKRLQPFLDCIQQYSGVIDTFVQVKPDVLALLWGPIKFLIQISSSWTKSLDKLLDITTQIGNTLPQFQKYEQLFDKNQQVSHVLCLFYRDILDFYAIALNFFRIKGWRVFFESLWPRYAEKISIVKDNMDRHRVLMVDEVTLASIIDAYTARISALSEHEKSQKFREQQQFESVKLSLNPRLYDDDLERIYQTCCKDTGRWLYGQGAVQKWCELKANIMPRLWLTGIPGAGTQFIIILGAQLIKSEGKTHLAAATIQFMMHERRRVLFAFLSYQNTQPISEVGILHSFMFQLIHEYRDLQPILQNAFENNYRKLRSNTTFNQELLCSMLDAVGMTFLVVDGLDEIDLKERRALLKTLIDISTGCSNMKLLISSREEADISRVLRSRSQQLVVGLKNTEDIRLYVHREIMDWLEELPDSSSVMNETLAMTQSIASKAEGMFLYARLVLKTLIAQPNLKAFKDEMNNLPDGLDEAYGRIIKRIKSELLPVQEAEAMSILKWVACSERPMRRQELQQARMIQVGARTIDSEREPFQDLVHLCGPIVEVRNGNISFVHFTAKEYLCGKQSGVFIETANAHRELAITCMTYLSLDYFTADLDDSQVDNNILRGNYTLLLYAQSYWLEHIKRGARSSVIKPSFHDLCYEIRSFLETQDIAKATDMVDSEEKQEILDLLPFKQHSPQTYYLLCYINSIHTRDSNDSDLDQAEYERAMMRIATFSTRIRKRIDELSCPTAKHIRDCHCESLQKHYGNSLFKCPRRSCKWFQDGFPSQGERNKHVKAHERPFKCSNLRCDFATMGFLSQFQLAQHLSICRENAKPMTVPIPQNVDLTSITLREALNDAIDIGQPEYFEALLQAVEKPLPIKLLSDLMLRALSSTSSKIVELLHNSVSLDLNNCGGWLLRHPVITAVEGGSLEILKYLLDNGADLLETSSDCAPRRYRYRHQYSALDLAVCLLSVEITQVLLASSGRWNTTQALQCLTGQRKLPEDHGDWVRQTRLDIAHLLLEHGAKASEVSMHGEYDPEFAIFLIENGADVNRSSDTRRKRNPLYDALMINTAESAEFAKMLMEHGADPTIRSGQRTPASLKGAQDIHKHLGITFDELVESTKGARQNYILYEAKYPVPTPRRQKPRKGTRKHLAIPDFNSIAQLSGTQPSDSNGFKSFGDFWDSFLEDNNANTNSTPAPYDFEDVSEASQPVEEQVLKDGRGRKGQSVEEWLEQTGSVTGARRSGQGSQDVSMISLEQKNMK